MGVGFCCSLLSVMFLKNEYLSGSSSATFFLIGEGVLGVSTDGLPGKEASMGEASRLASLPPRDIVGLNLINEVFKYWTAFLRTAVQVSMF